MSSSAISRSSTEVLERIQGKVDENKEAMPMCTAKLMLSHFLKAEKTGNWRLDLQSVHDMPSHFAPSGHQQYAKSAYVTTLLETHLYVHQGFEGRHHVMIGRTFHRAYNWAGAAGKYKDALGPNTQERNDRELVLTVGASHASMCIQQWYHAEVQRGLIWNQSLRQRHLKGHTGCLGWERGWR